MSNEFLKSKLGFRENVHKLIRDYIDHQGLPRHEALSVIRDISLYSIDEIEKHFTKDPSKIESWKYNEIRDNLDKLIKYKDESIDKQKWYTFEINRLIDQCNNLEKKFNELDKSNLEANNLDKLIKESKDKQAFYGHEINRLFHELNKYCVIMEGIISQHNLLKDRVSTLENYANHRK